MDFTPGETQQAVAQAAAHALDRSPPLPGRALWKELGQAGSARPSRPAWPSSFHSVGNGGFRSSTCAAAWATACCVSPRVKSTQKLEHVIAAPARAPCGTGACRAAVGRLATGHDDERP